MLLDYFWLLLPFTGSIPIDYGLLGNLTHLHFDYNAFLKSNPADNKSSGLTLVNEPRYQLYPTNINRFISEGWVLTIDKQYLTFRDKVVNYKIEI